MRHDDTKLVVRFTTVGQKTLREKYAKLEVAQPRKDTGCYFPSIAGEMTPGVFSRSLQA